MTRRLLIVLGLAILLGVVSSMVIQKELLLRNGRSVLLALAPVDPRSLIQGDYMILRYQIADEVRETWGEVSADGYLVVVTDEHGVATFRRIDDPSRPPAPDELLLRYRRRGSFLKLGVEAYYFQEGRSEIFANAAYGELKVTAAGQSLLVGLRDKNFKPLK